MTSPIDLVYVASIGRSGSTLLESMLGAHSRMATMGETHLWPHEVRQNVRPCACGKSVDECDLWSEVRTHTDPRQQSAPGIDFFREKYNGGKTLRPALLREFDRTHGVTPRRQAEIDTYAQNCADLFLAYRDQFERLEGRQLDWLVDASKDPYRLLWLKRSGMFNLKVVHMVKNPQAYAYSAVRRFISGPERSRGREWGFAARQTGAWAVQNHLFSRLARQLLNPWEYMLLSYEELALDPNAAFARVCRFVGVDFEPAAVEHFREGSVHTIAGNPMRYETRPIELDERWRTGLPRVSRWISRAVAAPVSGGLGY